MLSAAVAEFAEVATSQTAQQWAAKQAWWGLDHGGKAGVADVDVRGKVRGVPRRV
jgi:hypothetical protein